ncbi:MAG: FAD-dependent oxidoreductase [Candidatus Omnitrophota bacterium]|nr:FAD-dependent oxidoreductase [Candidatus Omnitrophota bacterium]
MKIYDLLILGAGPAGITAAVYASRKKLDFLVVTLDIGGQAAWSGDIENYTGYQFITGPELALKFQEHMNSFGIAVRMPQRVREVAKEGALVATTTDKEQYSSKAVIIATGKRPRPLNVPGEKEFKNKGVTYCATCDGPLFKNKPVAIIGGGNSALDAAVQMLKICPTVYLINIGPKLTGDPVMVDTVTKAPNAIILNDTKITKIFGDAFVKGIEVVHQGATQTFDVAGVFVEIGLIPNYDFSTLVNCNEAGEVIVDCHNQTNIEGIFAAGDVTNVPEKQIVIACGEGSKACLSAGKYLATHIFSV